MISVLIIDDDESMRSLFMTVFSNEGFQVEGAADAGVALMRLETTVYDLITLDLMMPGMSGLDFLVAFRAAYPESTTKIIVTSNIDNPTIVEKIRAMGINGYFVKSDQDPKVIVDYARSLFSAAETPPAPSAAEQPGA